MTVLITGGGSGIGHALSHGFLDDGATVYAVDRVREGLQLLTARGAITNVVDVSDQNQVDADILINGLIPGVTKSGMMPQGREPSVVYPAARMLATMPEGGPSGRVFWNEEEYSLLQGAE
jgi:uncharacterized protein YbjT (DUF2867 family)